MFKLNGHTLEKGVWFLPESQALTLTERSSTSTITLGPDAPAIGFNDWLYDEDSPGGPYVWRVKSITEQNSTNTISIELEHPINLLEDQQVFGEVTTEDISGSDTCYASEAVAYLLDGNHDWVLGDFEVDNQCPYEFETLSVLDAIKSVTDTLEGVYWDYDLSVHPFVLNIRALDMNPGCEMREGRNLSSLRRSVSRSGMYTRIYPIGENDLQLPDKYISRNEEIYGRIDKVVTDSTKTTLPMLGTWAEGLLMHNSDPDVSITISGLDLSESTGEPMDQLRLHRFCRCPLPEYGTTIIEKITKLQWRDRIKEPEVVTVTLANNTEDLSEVIKSESKAASGGGGAAGQAHQNYIFEANGEHLYYDVHNESGYLHGQLEMTAESLRIGFENEIQSTRSEFILTSESMRIHFENEISSTRSEIEMTSESLRIQFENEISSTRSEFEMTSESMRIEFQNEISSTRAEIRVEAGRISQIVEAVGDDGEVTAASIVLAINESEGTSEARIDAGHVYIGNEKSTTVIAGKTTLSEVEAEYFNTTYLNAAIGEITLLGVNAISVAGGTNLSGTLTVAGRASFPGGIAFGSGVGASVLTDCIADASVSGNTLTLTKASGGTVTFSKATSLSGAWSSGVFTATASPQGSTVTTSVSVGTATWSGNTASVPIKATINGGSTLYDVRTATVDATARYNAGWNYGLTTRVMSGTDAGSAQAIKTLSFGQKWKVTVTLKDSSGNNVTSDYVVAAPTQTHDLGMWADPVSGATFEVGVACWDSPSHIAAQMSRNFNLVADGNTVYARQSGSSSNLASITVGGYSYYGTQTLYYKYDYPGGSAYASAGYHNWYYT